MSNRFFTIPDEYLPEIDELPGELATIAKEVERVWPGRGVKVAMLFSQIFGGMHLYIRKADDLRLRIRNDVIRTEYDQGTTTMKQLAMKYSLSIRQVANILAEAHEGV